MSRISSLRNSSTSILLVIWAVSWPLLLLPERAPAATIIAAICLALVIFLVVRQRGRIRPRIIDGILMVYLSLSIVAYIYSPLPDQSLRRLTALLAGAAGYGLLTIWLEERQGRSQTLASGLALVGGVAALLALLVIEWPSRYLVDLSQITDRLPHLGGDLFVNNNTAAGVALFLLPLAAALFLQTRHRGRYLYLISAVAIVLVLILTQSRNAYLGLIFCAGAGLLWGRIRFRYVLAVSLLLVIMPFAAVAINQAADIQGAELVSAFDEGSKVGAAQDQSWLSRLEIWSAAVQTMRDYPVLGAGLYMFAPVSRANYVFQTVDPMFEIYHAHNLSLQTGATHGLAGWLTISLLWIFVIYGLWAVSRTSAASWLPRALAAGSAGYIVFNSFDILALEQRAGLTVWIILALSSAVIEESGIKQDRFRWLWAAPVILFALLLLTPLTSTNLARLELDKARLNRSFSLVSSDLDARLEGDYRRLGLLHYLRGETTKALQAWEKDPETGLFILNQGQQSYISSADLAGAVDWYSLSLSIDGDSGETYLWRGLALAELGETDHALADFEAAVIHGSNDYYHGVPVQAVAWANQGLLLLDRRELAESIFAFEQAIALAPEVEDFRIQLQDIQKLYDQLDQ